MSLYMRTFVLLCLFFPGIYVIGQNNYYYKLALNPTSGTITGSAKLQLYNSSKDPLDTIYLHYPSAALSVNDSGNNKGVSFFRKQYSEFQKVDLHFADPSEYGGIKVEELLVENGRYHGCNDCEFSSILLNNPLIPGDSIEISMRFMINLPQEDWLGSYYDKNEVRIIDWLPQFPKLDSNGFLKYPLTWQRDVYPSYDEYDIDLTLPENYLVATNATLTTKDELERISWLQEHTFSRLPESSSSKTIHFRHTGTNLQFIISNSFYVFPIANGGTLFIDKADPFVVSITDTINGRIEKFMRAEFGETLASDFNLVLLRSKKVEYQSDRLLSLKYPGNAFEFARELAQARFEAHYRYRRTPDGFQNAWISRGIPQFYKHQFIEEQYPDEFWSPLQDIFTGAFWQPLLHSFGGWLFSLDNFDYAYQNQYLYLFLARQGLDQPIATPADSLTRLNYKAMEQAKTYLAMNHLKEYSGTRNFKRAMHDFTFGKRGLKSSPKDLKSSFEYYVTRDVNWFFDDWIHSSEINDYALRNYDYCSTVATAKVKNKGRISIPYSITGYKDGDEVLTEWFEGHDGSKVQQLYHEDYDRLTINAHNQSAELNQKDNSYNDRLLFPRLKPVKFQFYQSMEDPNNTQVFWLPSLSYNAYDRLLLGMSFYNLGLVARKWEWYLNPSYSFGQDQLTGAAGLEYNYLPKTSDIFHRISGAVYGRYYHYDEGLAYFRISPVVKLRFRKPFPRSTILQQLRLRSVHMQRELGPEFEGVANEISNASYTVFNVTHRFEQTRILDPYTLITDLMIGDQFSRISVDADFRWMLPNKQWLIWRSFGGVFFANEFADFGINQNYYSLGLSGTQDFMFDYPFIGRSDVSGIWSQQFFVTDGGFKSETNTYSDIWMLTTGVNVPIWSVFGVFGDLGLVDGFDQIYYDYGIRISLLPDFLEVYFPIANNENVFVNQSNYPSNIRYVLNLDLGAIVHRLRRGYY